MSTYIYMHTDLLLVSFFFILDKVYSLALVRERERETERVYARVTEHV